MYVTNLKKLCLELSGRGTAYGKGGQLMSPLTVPVGPPSPTVPWMVRGGLFVVAVHSPWGPLIGTPPENLLQVSGPPLKYSVRTAWRPIRATLHDHCYTITTARSLPHDPCSTITSQAVDRTILFPQYHSCAIYNQAARCRIFTSCHGRVRIVVVELIAPLLPSPTRVSCSYC